MNKRTLSTKYNLENIKETLLQLCRELGRIPTNSEIIDRPTLPSIKVLKKYFEEDNITYQEFCKANGYKTKNKSKYADIAYDEICAIWEKWHNEFGHYPTEKDTRRKNCLPQWEKVKEVCGDEWNNFRIKHKMKIQPDVSKYQEYCDIFIKESEKIGRALKSIELDTYHEIYSYTIPSTRWMIENNPDEKVNCYNTFLEYLGYKPRYMISKELATKCILEKFEKQGRITGDDFHNHDHEIEIGITTITNHWGTFNNMLKELGLPLNWEKQRNMKTEEEIKSDILSLCEFVYKTENRRMISTADIDSCDWCFSKSMYHSYFIDVLGTTLRDYIESIGYSLLDCGKGMNFTFDDGERVLSQWEYKVSNYLREIIGLQYKTDYKKDVYYRTFIKNYTGNRTIDYVIFDKYYIEVAGVLLKKEYVEDEVSTSITKYNINLQEKKQMLENEGLEHYIIYPHDLTERPLDEVFYFLQGGRAIEQY